MKPGTISAVPDRDDHLSVDFKLISKTVLLESTRSVATVPARLRITRVQMPPAQEIGHHRELSPGSRKETTREWVGSDAAPRLTVTQDAVIRPSVTLQNPSWRIYQCLNDLQWVAPAGKVGNKLRMPRGRGERGLIEY